MKAGRNPPGHTLPNPAEGGAAGIRFRPESMGTHPDSQRLAIARRNASRLALCPRSLQHAQSFPRSAYTPTCDACTLQSTASVAVEVVDVLGRRVLWLDQGEQAAGGHEVTIHTGDIAAGAYAVMLRAEIEGRAAQAVRRLTVVR